MPWETPTLEDIRAENRDFVTAQLNSGPMIPNSVLRVMSDGNAGLAYLTLLYLDWLSKQFLPDTAENEWLGRHAKIWLGGRKDASFSSGTVLATGVGGTVIPSGTRLSASGSLLFEVTTVTTVGSVATSVPVRAITPGAAGNLEPGSSLSFTTAISGVDGTVTVVSLTGGADQETDDELRLRVLNRIRQPPMGGDADDYVAWALEVPGVTRAWCSPLEMGIGTVTVRFMMDDLRSSGNVMTNGFPLDNDLVIVRAHLDGKRPVAVKDFFVEKPVPEPINFTITNLDPDTIAMRAAIGNSVAVMLHDRARPAIAINGVGQDAQEIFAAWVSAAILDTPGVVSFDLVMTDHPMPTKGGIAVLGSIA